MEYTARRESRQGPCRDDLERCGPGSVKCHRTDIHGVLAGAVGGPTADSKLRAIAQQIRSAVFSELRRWSSPNRRVLRPMTPIAISAVGAPRRIPQQQTNELERRPARKAFDTAMRLAGQLGSRLQMICVEEEIPRHGEVIDELREEQDRADSYFGQLEYNVGHELRYMVWIWRPRY